MDAGIRTNEAVNSVYKQLIVDRKIKALVMKINEKTELEVEAQFPTEGFKYDDFVAAFPSDHGRFAVIDFDYEYEEKISRLSSFYGLLLTVKPYKR